VLEIRYFDKLESTQKYLIQQVKEAKVTTELAVVAKEQIAGVGSRNNSWQTNRGDLTFSFVVERDSLPKDMPISSASIFFAFIMKQILHEYDKNCWLKWPNDIYIKNKKAGGIVTQLLKQHLVVGIGINITNSNSNFAKFDKIKNVENMLTSYFMLLKNSKNWQEVFSKYKIEFEKQKSFSVHIKGKKTTLKVAKLCDDGALLVNNERIYSLR
jgi:BirA family biotin operon repressor/biotin-[acetyl-CoA-carboxylase] ligase